MWLPRMDYVLGHVRACRFVRESPCHSEEGGGPPNEAQLCAPGLLPHHSLTPAEHFSMSKSRSEGTSVEALQQRKSHKGARRPFAFERRSVLSF